jgi:hypothetical protein
MSKLRNIKVRIRNAEGQYLTGNAVHYWFSADFTRALVFDYVADEVEARLALIAKTQGLALNAVPIEPKEFLEMCDQCNRMVAPAKAFFDGTVFLCGSCKRRPSAVAMSS